MILSVCVYDLAWWTRLCIAPFFSAGVWDMVWDLFRFQRDDVWGRISVARTVLCSFNGRLRSMNDVRGECEESFIPGLVYGGAQI